MGWTAGLVARGQLVNMDGLAQDETTPILAALEDPGCIKHLNITKHIQIISFLFVVINLRQGLICARLAWNLICTRG